MGGVQVTVSWSTDGLVTVMFPTGPGDEAGEEGKALYLEERENEYYLIVSLKVSASYTTDVLS